MARPKLHERKEISPLEREYAKLRVTGATIDQAAKSVGVPPKEMARRERVFAPLQFEIASLRKEKQFLDTEGLSAKHHRILVKMEKEFDEKILTGDLPILEMAKWAELLQIIRSERETVAKIVEDQEKALQGQSKTDEKNRAILMFALGVMGQTFLDLQGEVDKWQKKYWEHWSGPPEDLTKREKACLDGYELLRNRNKQLEAHYAALSLKKMGVGYKNGSIRVEIPYTPRTEKPRRHRRRSVVH